MSPILSGALLFGLNVAYVTPASGQELAWRFLSDSPRCCELFSETRPQTPRTFEKLWLGATFGSLVGSFAGWKLGDEYAAATDCCRGDDPGLEARLFGGAIGGTAGAALGAWIIAPNEKKKLGTLIPSALVAALIPGSLFLLIAGPEAGGWVAFSIGQGLGTAFFATREGW